MNKKNKTLMKAILPWVVVLVVLTALIPILGRGQSSEVNYNKFMTILENETIEKVEVKPDKYVTKVEMVKQQNILLKQIYHKQVKK